jgi:hypothetical protein
MALDSLMEFRRQRYVELCEQLLVPTLRNCKRISVPGSFDSVTSSQNRLLDLVNERHETGHRFSRTHYSRPVLTAGDLLDPTLEDLASFIVDNAHGNLLIECILGFLWECNLNVFRGSACLNALPFLFFRYPDRANMKGLRKDPRHDKLAPLASILRNGGYDFGPSDNILDQYKIDIKQFLKTTCKSLEAELEIDDKWLKRLLPNPSLSSYGQSIIPPPGGALWVNSRTGNCALGQVRQRLSAEMVTLQEGVDLALSVLAKHCPQVKRDTSPSQLQTKLCLVSSEYTALLEEIGNHAANEPIETAGLWTSECGLEWELTNTPLLNGAPNSQRPLFLPFNRGLSSRRPTTPELCSLFDTMSARKSLPTISIQDGTHSLRLCVPFL